MAEKKITIEMTLEEAKFNAEALDSLADSMIDGKRDMEEHEIPEHDKFIDKVKRLQYRIEAAIRKQE